MREELGTQVNVNLCNMLKSSLGSWINHLGFDLCQREHKTVLPKEKTPGNNNNNPKQFT
jgi:hypothetical protein